MLCSIVVLVLSSCLLVTSPTYPDDSKGAAFYLSFEDEAQPLKNCGLVGTGATPVANPVHNVSLGVRGNCFDNSGQTPEEYQEPIVYTDEALKVALKEVTSFTITFWLRSNATYTHARPLHIPGLIDLNHANGNRIAVLLEGPKQWYSSTDGAEGPNYGAEQWRFVAIVYDGTLASDNLCLYYGSMDEEVAMDKIYSADHGTLTASNPVIILGNYKDGFRPFPGFIDEVRIWVSKTGDAALDVEELELIRQYDVSGTTGLE